jgi:hypothetical protein
MAPPPRRVGLGWSDAAIALLLAAFAAVLYLPRLLPGTGFSADTMKYHYIGVVLGISHPPGSPLYMLLDGLVARLPFGELAWRLNLLSAISAAAAASFLYLLARQIAASRVAACLAAAALMIAAMFWEQSLVAEVYTPHAAFLIGSVWLLVRWHHDGRRSDLGTAAALYGLSFGIHVMSWFLLPMWVATTLAGPRSIVRRPREAALVAGGALAGVCTYLYYVIRPLMGPAYVEFPIDGAGRFFDFVTGAQFRGYMFAFDAPTMLTDRLQWLADLARANVGVPLLALAAAGAFVLTRKDWRLAVGFVAAVALSSIYAMGYSVPDAYVDAMPALYLTLALSAVGFASLVRFAALRVRTPHVSAVATVVMLIAIGAERHDDLRRNAVVLDRSGEDRLARYANRVFKTVQPGSTILTGSDPTFHALAYHTLGLGRGHDAGIVVISQSGRSCEDVLAASDRFHTRGEVYASMEIAGCLVDAGRRVQGWDFSRTLPEYLRAVRRDRLVLIAIRDEGTAALDAATWSALDALGVLKGVRGREGWSYAAAFVRTADGFAGLSDAGERGASVVLERGGRIAGAYRTPVAVAVHSGGQASGRPAILAAGGVDYGRSHRGVQVLVLDLATGTPIERQVFDTHRTTSLRDLDFVRVVDDAPR